MHQVSYRVGQSHMCTVYVRYFGIREITTFESRTREVIRMVEEVDEHVKLLSAEAWSLSFTRTKGSIGLLCPMLGQSK
jgi:hypothetical protein